MYKYNVKGHLKNADRFLLTTATFPKVEVNFHFPLKKEIVWEQLGGIQHTEGMEGYSCLALMAFSEIEWKIVLTLSPPIVLS